MTGLRDQSVLVTGAAGFIGSHLVDALLAAGARVRALDNLATGRLENLAHCVGAIELLEGDIRDAEVCRRACQEVSVVFHQAALGSVPRSMADPVTTIAVNVEGTANVFWAARQGEVRRVIYASSSSVYGESQAPVKKEGEEGEPLSPYALSKLMNEQLARTFARCYGMELLGLRYFNVYGPRQDPEGPYAAVVPRFFSAYRDGKAPVIYGDGEQSRDFTFVSDAVSANLLAASAPAASCGAAYNVAGGGATTVKELARLVRDAVGAGALGLEPRYEPPRPGDVKHSRADLTLARESLGYVPATSISSGLVISREHFFRSLAPSPS